MDMMEVGINPQTPIMKYCRRQFYGRSLKEYYRLFFEFQKKPWRKRSGEQGDY